MGSVGSVHIREISGSGCLCAKLGVGDKRNAEATDCIQPHCDDG